jgi:hypothetical protein
MTTLSRIKLSALILLAAGTLNLRADSISGSYSNDCTGLVKLWDLSGTYGSSDGTESETVVLDMDARGAITGTGHFDVNDDADATYLHTDVNVRGKLSSAGKVTRVKLTFVGTSGTGQVQGRDVTFRLTLNDSFELDGDARMLVGKSGGKLKIRVPATGVTRSRSLRPEPTTENLPDEVDGAWGLSLTTAPANNKYNGAGILQLSNGKLFDLAATGSYASKTDLSKISLKSADKTAPIVLSLVEQNLNNSLSIFSIKGKALGQNLNFKQ